VYQSADWPGFGRQRQRAQGYVTTPWCLWIDADERISPELRTAILRVVRSNPGACVYAFPRLNWFFGRFIRHCGLYPKTVVRLYPTSLTRYDDADVHECVHVPEGVNVSVLRGDLWHYPYVDLRHYMEKSALCQ
jgi:(heptosyl)LPS beta-1,4-glucosyltransferase